MTNEGAVVAGDGRLHDAAVRRWTAAGVAAAVAVFWMLGSLGRPWLLFAASRRTTSDFFDLQASSLLQGRLTIPAGSLGIEEFVTPRGSHMYFGIFPAVLRLPFTAVFGNLDSRFGLFSCLLAVVVAGVATARLARRMQRQMGLVDGPSPRWYAAIGAAPVLASPFLFLGSAPVVYHEAIAWGAAAALWGVDAAMQWWFLRRGRDALWMLLAAAIAVSSRASVGLLPLVMAALLAVLLLARRQFRPACVAGGVAAIAMLSYSIVDVARFRQWWGAPAALQRAYDLVPEQQAAVALTDGSLFSVRFMPTTVVTYLDPVPMLRLTRLFPFVRPAGPIAPLGSAPMQVAPAGSIWWAAPVLVALAAVGGWWIVRRGDTVWRVAAVAGLVTSVATFGFWAVWHRYLVDFVPLLVIAAVPGFWVTWEWARSLGRGRRRSLVAAAVAVGVLAMAVQIGIGLWNRLIGFVPVRSEQLAAIELRYRIDDALVGGMPPGLTVLPVDAGFADLPPADLGDVVIAGDCDALYVLDLDWVPLERPSGGGRRAVVTASPQIVTALRDHPQLVASGDGWRLETSPLSDGSVAVVYVASDGVEVSGTIDGTAGGVTLDVVVDPVTAEVSVTHDGRPLLSARDVRPGFVVAPGWTVEPSDAPACRRILDRVSSTGR